MSTIGDIQAVFAGQNPEPDDSLGRRLQTCFAQLGGLGTCAGPTDLAVLVRQALLRARDGGARLRVPIGPRLPDISGWRRVGCAAEQVGPDHLAVAALPWSPEWLDPGADEVVRAAAREEVRAHRTVVAGDPALRLWTGLDGYRTLGQREAVRAIFTARPGATLLIVLPTGAGKSLAFQLPAVAGARAGESTVVIVPTIALARDQEARARSILERNGLRTDLPLAWHSGLDDAIRNDIRDALRTGRLPILFASPEAALGGLRGALFDCASRGRLRLFAVDEAHMVAQWGSGFRPEFQALAGLRDSLLRAAPTGSKFATVLATATLTEEAFRLLGALYGEVELVAEPALRPEPAFLLHKAQSTPDRDRRVMDALHHLPRPLLLYVTERDDVLVWRRRLNLGGFLRVGAVRGGDLQTDAGAQVLQEWRDGTLDVVVATSAFGLGMDQEDVRSVVHACLPETIDRYYQEVGRAGRDGRAAVALLAVAPEDRIVAKSIGEERRISVDRCVERWQAMWHSERREDLGAGNWVVNVEDHPPDLAGTGDRNAAWNLRTLVLMAQCGAVRLGSRAQQVSLATTASDTARRDREVVVHEVQLDRLEERVRAQRAALHEADRAGQARLHALLAERTPFNDIFREHYRWRTPSVSAPPHVGSCPITRAAGRVDHVITDSEVFVSRPMHRDVGLRLAAVLRSLQDENGRSFVSWTLPAAGLSRRAALRDLQAALRFLVADGVVEIAIPEELIDDRTWADLLSQAPGGFLTRATLDERDPPLRAPPELPRLSVLDAAWATQEGVATALAHERPLHIIVMPPDAPDPDHPSRPFLPLVPHLDLLDLLDRLQA